MIIYIIKREYLRLKPSFIPLFLFMIIVPILIHVVIGFPLHDEINNIDGLKFLYWIAPGICVFTSALTGYFLTLDGINNLLSDKRHIETLCSMPIGNKQILSGILLWSVLVSLAQWLISSIITSILNNEFYTLKIQLRLFIQTFPSIIFFVGLGALNAILTTNKYWHISLSFLFFTLLGFGFGCFIPLKNFPIEIISFLKLVPISNLISGAHSIIFQGTGSFTGGIFSFILGLFLILVSLGLSNKRFRI